MLNGNPDAYTDNGTDEGPECKQCSQVGAMEFGGADIFNCDTNALIPRLYMIADTHIIELVYGIGVIHGPDTIGGNCLYYDAESKEPPLYITITITCVRDDSEHKQSPENSYRNTAAIHSVNHTFDSHFHFVTIDMKSASTNIPPKNVTKIDTTESVVPQTCTIKPWRWILNASLPSGFESIHTSANLHEIAHAMNALIAINR